MDKLDALKFFIIASETLNFREAAIKLSVSPSVVTRTVAELEKQLDEPLFKRNTGNDSNLLIVSYVQIMPDDFVMQLHRF